MNWLDKLEVSSCRICGGIRDHEFYAESAELDHSGARTHPQRTGVEAYLLGADPAQHKSDITVIPRAAVLFARISAGEDMGDLPL